MKAAKRRGRATAHPERKALLVEFTHGDLTGRMSLFLPESEGRWVFADHFAEFHEAEGDQSTSEVVIVVDRSAAELPAASHVGVSVYDPELGPKGDVEPAPELGSYSDRQLIAELIRRPMFTGLVLDGWPDPETPQVPDIHRCLRFDDEQTATILEHAHRFVTTGSADAKPKAKRRARRKRATAPTE